MTDLHTDALRARMHFNEFVALIQKMRDVVLDADYNVIPKYEPLEHLLAYIDDETQHVHTRVDGLVRESKAIA